MFKRVAAGEGDFVVDFHTGNHGVNTLFVEGSEIHAGLFEELMAGMFEVMLVISIIDDTLEVALVIPHFQLNFKYIILHFPVLSLKYHGQR